MMGKNGCLMIIYVSVFHLSHLFMLFLCIESVSYILFKDEGIVGEGKCQERLGMGCQSKKKFM